MSNACLNESKNRRFLDRLRLPDDLRRLEVVDLTQIANELREELIECISGTGGHFASSLGATEIAVALHHSFNTPHDRIVWDVGHQAYVHKMLTGRRHLFSTLRRKGGLSGFLKRSESEYDCFGAGHAGTSISAAAGMSLAFQREHPERYVVAVVGDASIANGMAFEAMNHVGELALKNFIVLLNDNEMSISPNVGALSWLFSGAATSAASTRLRARLKNLYEKGYVPNLLYKAMDRAEEVTQGFLSSASMLFGAFGFRYIGPVDGHDMQDLLTALKHAKSQDVPVLVHAVTVKGKGYRPAELDPQTWHGVAPFDRQKGKFLKVSSPCPKRTLSYTEVFGQTIVELAKQDPRIVGITAAMASGTGLDRLQREVPQAFFDVGICEQHAVTFAAGMACEGYRPVCAIYSTFLQRTYDQVVHDVCLQNLPVVFAVDRAGAVGADGETHQGAFDIAYLRHIPNMVLMSPKDENELRHMLYTALAYNGPTAIRYPRSYGWAETLDETFCKLEIGKAEVLMHGEEVLFLCYGPLVQYALSAADRLLTKHDISSTVINARFVKPLDGELLARELLRHRIVVTLEDHCLQGGFGSAVLEFISEQGFKLPLALKRFGMRDIFTPHATPEEQHAMHGYSLENLYRYVISQFEKKASFLVKESCVCKSNSLM